MTGRQEPCPFFDVAELVQCRQLRCQLVHLCIAIHCGIGAARIRSCADQRCRDIQQPRKRSQLPLQRQHVPLGFEHLVLAGPAHLHAFADIGFLRLGERDFFQQQSLLLRLLAGRSALVLSAGVQRFLQELAF